MTVGIAVHNLWVHNFQAVLYDLATVAGLLRVRIGFGVSVRIMARFRSQICKLQFRNYGVDFGNCGD